MKNILIASLAIFSAASSMAQTKWDLPTGYPEGSFQTENVQRFAKDVDAATGGKLKISVHPNGELYKANEIKRVVQSGQTQAGEILLSSAANENPLFGLDSVPFLATSYADARKLYTASKPATEKLLATQGLKLLFSVPWPGQSLYSVKPVGGPDDIKGSKMRAYNPATTRIAQMLKAQPITVQLVELPQALATGTVDNFLTSSASGVENKLYEQAKYFYNLNAWMPRNATIVSLKAFDALDKPSQDALLKAAAAAEVRGWKASEQKDGEFIKELAAKGMKVGAPSEALQHEMRVIGTTMTADWIKSAGAEGQAIVDAFNKR